jgi:hypothetical protein
MNVRATVASSVLAVFALVSYGSQAEAQTVIKNPGDHPRYRAELEPHGTLSIWSRYYGGRYYRGRFGNGVGDPEGGVGFRAAIKIVDPGFIPKINDTVAISFGVDITNCNGCARYDFSIWSPVALNWNFFLTDKWSVFADIGFVVRSFDFYRDAIFDFYGALGGRYHFNDTVALTMRLGYPLITVGASFFIGG